MKTFLLGEIIRPPAVSGQFYPQDKSELEKMIAGFFEKARLEYSFPAKEPVALIVPHAGYIYSGQCAAYAYKTLLGKKIDYVFLLGNSHHYNLNRAAIYDGEEWKTPLGRVKVARDLVKKIVGICPDQVEINNAVHLPEHSLEVQLPFLQKSLSDFQIVPLLLSGGISLDGVDKIAIALEKVIREIPVDKNILLVASSDMSHYPGRVVAEMIDAETLKAIEAAEPMEIFRVDERVMKRNLANVYCTLCGREAVYLIKKVARNLGASHTLVLNYDNSAMTSGDSSRVVGYGAVVFSRLTPEKIGKLAEGKMKTFAISEKNQRTLLNLARQAIREFITQGKIIQYNPQEQELTTPAAAFVTLTESGNLRGCIGMTMAMKPLYQTVIEMAVAAATEDTRFPPVEIKELDKINVEISVLSPLTRVESAEKIVPHKHGVVVRQGGRSGLFLPQVWEHFTKKEDFLNELCWQKAGLPPDAWKDKNTELYVFTVFAFSDEKLLPDKK